MKTTETVQELQDRIRELEAQKTVEAGRAAEEKARADSLELSVATVASASAETHGLTADQFDELALFVACCLEKRLLRSLFVQTQKWHGPAACQRIGAFLTERNSNLFGCVRIELQRMAAQKQTESAGAA